MKKANNTQIINRRARYDYDIEDTITAGIVLDGHEVKSIRLGHMSLKGAYATITRGELWLLGATVSPYQHATLDGSYDPARSRKLLVTKRELERLKSAKQNGLSIVPIRVLKDTRFIKVELGIGRGKKQRDKRQDILARSAKRQAKAGLKRSK